GARSLSLRLLPSANPPAGQPPLAGLIPLEYWRADHAAAQFDWLPLPASLSFPPLAAGAEQLVRLGVRRPDTSSLPAGAQYQGLLEVTDDLGTRWQVPVSADASATAVAAGPQLNNGSSVSPRAGLWVGSAVIDAVSQPAHPGDPNLTRPAGGDFTFRLLVHVDAGGNARLLQRAFLVRKPPVMVPDPANPGFNIIGEPARTVVLTDESFLSPVIGNGEVVGRRISSAAFGFSQPVLFSGGPFGAGTLGGTVTVGFDDPLNPFKHVYHPDHDNLDERFEQTLPEGRESFTVSRDITLEFTPTDPLGLNSPGWGSSEVGGHYRELITGLHRRPIRIAGTFQLIRVAEAAALNDGQGPTVAQAGNR
ncbi:MAG TPA: hypothetical protein DCY13_10380, partial [Verrucomicrobiales bacterium]|nr:hypothetical protein [Verrucomicrobiales bacterium]